MIPKYTVEYSTNFRRHTHTNHYTTDDPAACKEFIEHLLDEGCSVRSIKHEGVNLEQGGRSIGARGGESIGFAEGLRFARHQAGGRALPLWVRGVRWRLRLGDLVRARMGVRALGLKIERGRLFAYG